jgi:hypothetical protein
MSPTETPSRRIATPKGAVAAGIDPRRRLKLSPRATHTNPAKPRDKGRPYQQPPRQNLSIEPQQHNGGEHKPTHGTPPPPTIQIRDRHPDVHRLQEAAMPHGTTIS